MIAERAPETPLKWAGGKRWLAPHLRQLWQAYLQRQPQARLVEPFCGSLSVALNLQPERALLNDLNPHLVNFWRQVQRGLQVTLPMANEKALYYAHRDRFNTLIATGQAESAEAAQLFYYLNRTGFNGLCRFNKKGRFNVPFGRYKRIAYWQTADFARLAPYLARWTFTAGNFDALALQPEDFIYADPPYDVEFTSYSAGGFSWADQVRLAEWLSAHPGPVVLSNQATARIVELYQACGFELLYLEAPRRISANGDRAPACEVLSSKNISLDIIAMPVQRKLIKTRSYPKVTKRSHTGKVPEDLAELALKKGGYSVQKQVDIGVLSTGKTYRADLVASKSDSQFLISLKWQQSPGTAEEKIPFEVICLIEAVQKSNGKYKHAYLVLGGDGWTLRDYYTSGKLCSHLNYQKLVTIITLEKFIGLANNAQL
jgi:DNA adenine methylase